MKKKVLLLAVLALCLVCACAAADGSFKLEKGSITAIPEGMTDVVIPAEVDGEAVLAVSSYAMANNEDITGISIPEGVVILENGAVYYNPSLTSLTLPSTLQVISTYNVWSCDALEEVVIPASVQYIGDYSFYANEELSSVTFLGKPPVVAETAFYGLNDNCMVYVPDDYLKEYTLALPEDVTVIPSGKNAEVVDRTLAETDLDFDAATGTITGYHGTAVAGDVPASIGGVAVTAIGESVFTGLDCSLRFVTLPEGLTAIGSKAFDHARLLAVTFPTTLKVIGDYAFDWNVDMVPYWAQPNGVEIIGAHAFEATDVPNTFHIPDGVREIGAAAFYNNRFGEVYFPASVKVVGDAAFGKSPYLSYMAFAGGDLPQFGADVFDCQERLEDVDIAWDASRAQQDAASAVFEGMGMTECIVWRNNPGVVGVADHAKSGYADGLLVTYDGEMPNVTVYTSYDNVNTVGVGEGCFENNQTIERFYPHHCGWFTTIGARAFQNSSLQYIELFDSITEIGEDAFCGTKLTSVVIPASVTSIGGGAFAWCSELTDVTVLCDPELLPDDAFSAADQVTLHVSDDVSPKACKALAERLEVNVERASGIPEDIACPYTATNPDDFWIDENFQRLDQYEGYELNLVLPQERNGVALTMLSGNTLERARSGELPVRSVVVPEKYEEIVYNAFNDLPDLEVVVIYAPQPKAFNTMFANCPNLRAVIFVNGVDKAYDYAFRNCPALETVYFGADAEVEEGVFFECGSMTADAVATALPDVDALLAAVKSDPLPAPEPVAAPEAQPITDSNAAAYLGAWNLQSMDLGGESINPADFGLTMSFIFTDDGVVTIASNDGDEATLWRMENGAAFLMSDVDNYVPIVLNEDGSITVSEDGMDMVFVRGEPASSAGQVPAEAMGFVGGWANDAMGMSLQVNENGTMLMTSGGESQQTAWGYENGAAYMVLGPGSSVPMVLTETGLEIRADNMTLSFTRSEGVAPAPVAADAGSFVGFWVNDMLGMTADIHEDGSVIMTSGGETVPTTWFVEGGQAYMALDVGFNVPMVLTEDGMELRADNMTLAFTRSDVTAVGGTDGPETVGGSEFAGHWDCIWLLTGFEGCDPVTTYGGDWSFVINADGTAKMNAGAPTEDVLEVDEYGFTRFNGMAIVIREDGRLQYGSEQSGGMIFSKVPGDQWNPDVDTFVNPGEVVAAEISQQGAEQTMQTQGTAMAAPAALADRIGMKFVVTSATASGFTMDASMLGGEYAITFAANNDALFVMAGIDVPGLKWTADEAAFHVTYYDGTDLVFVATPEGFDLDFYGAMVYHFVPAE